MHAVSYCYGQVEAIEVATVPPKIVSISKCLQFQSIQAGVDMLALAPIIIVEINKQFGETWKVIRKI